MHSVNGQNHHNSLEPKNQGPMRTGTQVSMNMSFCTMWPTFVVAESDLDLSIVGVRASSVACQSGVTLKWMKRVGLQGRGLYG
jgi:hypothetical protein